MPEYIIQFLLAAAIGTIAYFLRDYKTRQDKKDEELQQQIESVKIRQDEKDKEVQEQIESVKTDLSKYKLEALDKFNTKDDFVRYSAISDRKLDKIYDEIIKLSKKKTEV